MQSGSPWDADSLSPFTDQILSGRKKGSHAI